MQRPDNKHKTRFWQRICVLICLAILAGMSPLAHAEPDTDRDVSQARTALKEAERGDWRSARYYATRSRSPVLLSLISWMEYTLGDSKVEFKNIAEFVRKHQDWPHQTKLRIRAEKAMIQSDASAQEVLAWFANQPVQTSYGRWASAEAKLKTGAWTRDNAEFLTEIREAWARGDFDQNDRTRFIESYGKLLRQEDYEAHVDQLIWDRELKEARKWIHHASAGKKALFEARMALKENAGNVDGFVRKVPTKLTSDPGLIFERYQWQKRKGRDFKDTKALLSVPASDIHRDDFWPIRINETYELLDRKHYKDAYALIKNHGFTSGANFADGEWLAGWIALRFLADPRAAYRHFYALYQGVTTPVSKARAAYWAGMAAAANQNTDISKNWLKEGAKYPNAFYGQLAAAKLGETTLAIPPQPTPTKADEENYKKNDLMEVAKLLYAQGDKERMRLFLKAAIAKAKTPAEQLLISQYGTKVGKIDLTVIAAKEALANNTLIIETAYPKLKSVPVKKPEPGLVHAIVRQESQFDPRARSSAGAVGMMQLLPSTAKQTARAQKIGYSATRLTSDPNYNIRLGSAYLQRLIDNYDGSYIMAIAAYNAGPGNVSKWVREHGDPRNLENVDQIIDWMEKIPFKETRNYVQRVLENLQLYRHALQPDATAYNLILDDLKR